MPTETEVCARAVLRPEPKRGPEWTARSWAPLAARSFTVVRHDDTKIEVEYYASRYAGEHRL